MKSVISRSSFIRGRCAKNMGTLSFEKFGVPAQVLSFNSTVKISSEPKASQIKVSVKASQILTDDIRALKGISSAHRSVGIAGTTAVGTVTGVPSGELDLSVNDSVLVVGSGTWTDEAIVPRSSVTKLPSLPAEEAATLPSVLSAWAMLNNFAKLKAGDVIIQSSGDSATGRAISQMGAALGYKVLSPSSAELKDPKFVSNLKDQKDSIKLAITDRSGRVSTDLMRVVADGAAVVVYNGVTESITQAAEGLDQPAAGAIYKDVSIHGFDLAAWYSSARTDGSFQSALSAVLALSKDKKVQLKAKVYPQADFQKAITDVETNSATAVLKF